MKISVGKPIYPGHTGRTWQDVSKVFLDGKEIEKVVMLDTEKGVIEKLVTTLDGTPIIFNNALGIERLRGKVRVEWK